MRVDGQYVVYPIAASDKMLTIVALGATAYTGLPAVHAGPSIAIDALRQLCRVQDKVRRNIVQRLKAAAVQFNHVPGDKAANLAKIRSFVDEAVAKGVDVIVFPEMCITGYWHVRHLTRAEIEALAEPVPSGPTSQALLALSASSGMTIGAGLIEIDEGGVLYNSYVVAMPDGRWACHRKLHCFISEHMASGSSYTVFDAMEENICSYLP